MKTTSLISASFLLVAMISSFSLHAQKNKVLEGKKYTVQFYEMKASGRGKAQPTMVFFKGGKVSCDLMDEKIQLPAITYKITNDSTFTEDDMENHLITFEASYSEDKNDYKWEGTVTNYDIEGIVTQSKNGVERKKYEFSGGEKTKK